MGLAIVTIASHRAHTTGVLLKTEANDHWAHYQSKRIKLHNLELGEDLIGLLGARTTRQIARWSVTGARRTRYERESKKGQDEARKKEVEGGAVEQRALRYDFGEGLLEIALVLTSLYFISRKMLFPVIGIIAGIAGAVIAIPALAVVLVPEVPHAGKHHGETQAVGGGDHVGVPD